MEIDEIQKKEKKNLWYCQICTGKGFKNKAKSHNTVDCYDKPGNEDKHPHKTSSQKPSSPGPSKNKNQLFRAQLMKLLEEESNNLSVSKVRWPELSQLPLCSEFDKENSMEFSLISLLLIHFTTVAMRLFSHSPHITLIMWPTVTVTCDSSSHHRDIVTKSHDTFPRSTL